MRLRRPRRYEPAVDGPTSTVRADRTPTASVPQLSEIAGRYAVKGVLGQGGAGVVLRVWDRATGRELALKRLLPREHSAVPTEDACLHFRREFHTLVAIRHPRIVEAFDYGVDGRGPFYTMELLEGRDLRDAGTLPIEMVTSVMRDVASALGFLHGRGVVHRDVTTRNVRCTGDGRAKLIDFGVMCSAGASGHIAGTPPCVAPETLRGRPVDHRADIYGLGTLAYRLLTGRHAYPARRIAELERTWLTRPPRPSELRPDVPEGLEDLVLDMLSLDPLGRPASMFDVIDRLSALGCCPPRTDEIAGGFLRSATMVGRERERAELSSRLAAAREGEGHAVVVEGWSGLGKTRMLRELRHEAQLAGTRVLATATAGEPAPWGVVRALATAALAECRADALEAAAGLEAHIGRAVPELARAPFGPARSDDPMEDRLKAQIAAATFFIRLARKRPLVMLIDDVQRADEGSAGVLGALAREAPNEPLLLVTALRMDDATRAPHAMSWMLRGCSIQRLKALEPQHVEALVAATFGELAGSARLARWLCSVGGGSPMLCRELFRWLVDHGHLRAEAGAWVLVSLPADGETPLALAEAMDARIAALSPAARRVAEILAVRGKETRLGRVVKLSAPMTEGEVFDALDELAFQEVLDADDGVYRFPHDSLREAFLRNLEPERSREIHLRLAAHLSRRGPLAAHREAQLGFHLLHGGERERAADVLASAGKKLCESFAFSDCIAPLEAALEVYEETGAPVKKSLAVRRLLLGVGATADPELILRYADRTIADLARASGAALARRIGGLLGVLVGLFVATCRFLVTRPRDRGPFPAIALRDLIGAVCYTVVSHAGRFDVERAQEVAKYLEPFGALSRTTLGRAFGLCTGMMDLVLGRWEVTRREANAAIETLRNDRLLSALDRRIGLGTATYALAYTSALAMKDDHEAQCESLDALGLRFEVAATVARAARHRLRGDETLAMPAERAVEWSIVQRGAGWLFEPQMLWASGLGYAISHDSAGLRRTLRELELLEARVHTAPWLTSLVRGEYLRSVGRLEAARVELETAHKTLPAGDRIGGPWTLTALSETWLALGATDLAWTTARAAVHAARELDHPALVCRALCALAASELALGSDGEARRRVDEAIAIAEQTAAPSLRTAAHLEAARCAASEGDARRVEVHRREALRAAREAKNPALVARVRRLESRPVSESRLRLRSIREAG